MATPVGHYLLGLSITQILARDPAQRRRGLCLASIACLPDLDLIPGLFVGDLARFHHGASHSFAAALLFSLGVLFLLKWWTRKLILSVVLLSFVLYASHALLDFFTLDPGKPHGVPFFWPWQLETYQSPWPLLPHVQHTRAPIFSIHNLFLVIREMLLFLPLVGLIQSLKIGRWPWPRTASWFYGSWFAAALWVSAFSLR
jgi:inner membrane protein